LLTAQHLQNITNELGEMDQNSEKKIKFFIRQLIDALSPSNFFLTNPEVLQNFLRTGGKTVLKGLNNMLSDLEQGDTLLNMTLTDLKAFEVGKNLATTPGKVIYQNPLLQLIQYQPTSAQVYSKPLLIIPPWINKYYILDLSENNSLVKWLVNQGYTIFLISWINPDKRYAQIDFQDYLLKGLLPALDIIKKAMDCQKINVLGFCIGGTLLATAMAYLTAKKANCIGCATYLTTLLDFNEPGDIGNFVDKEKFSILQEEILQTGYLSGRILKMIFNLLRPNDLIWSYVIKNYLQGEEPLPIDFLFWNSDTTNLPAQMVITYLREFYLHNQLKSPGGFKINDVPIDLRIIKNPVYFLSTIFDHIAPWKSTYAGITQHSGPVTFVLGGAGHVAGVVNPPNKNKYGYYTNETLPNDPESWLQTAKENAGSWWTHWEEWLRNYSGDFVSAPQPGGGKLKPIEDAPGTYVLRRLEEIEDSESKN
jgi:polyhydroxyalkanoate synthase